MNGKTEQNNFQSERSQIQAENNLNKFSNEHNQIIPRTQSAAAKPKSKLKATSAQFQIPPTNLSIDPQSKPFLPNQNFSSEFLPKKDSFQETIPMTESITISKPLESPVFSTPIVSTPIVSTTETANLATSQTITQPTTTTTTEKPKKKLQLKKESLEFKLAAGVTTSAEQSFKPTENVNEKPNTEWAALPPKKTVKSPEKLPGEQKPALSNINPSKSEERVEEVKSVENKPEESKSAEKQPVEQTFVAPQKVAEVVVTSWSRADFEAKINSLAPGLAEVELPAELAAIVSRKVTEHKPQSKPNKKPAMNQGQRNDMSQSQGQFDRGGNYKKEVAAPVNSSGIQRTQMTEEEIKKKKELQDNVGKWINTISKVDDEDEKNRRLIRMNLNKITPQNFDAVKEDIINIVILKPTYVEVVSELIIENAWTQKKYANIYAKLCNFLGSHEKIPVDEADPKKKRNKFKSVTLKKIQRVFQNEENVDGKTKKPEAELTKEEKIEIHDKKLKKILGNVCFIGELFLEKFIVIDIVRIITRTQLNSFLSEYDHYQKSPENEKPLFRNYEDTLEGLLKFYELIGKEFEDKEKTKGVDKNGSAKVVEAFEDNLFLAHSSIEGDPIPDLPDKENVTLEDLFRIFDLVLEKANLTQRLGALIRNLKHRKENAWNAPLYKNQGPQKIDEIHQEYQRELEQQERNKEMYYEEMNNRGSRGKKNREQAAYSVQYTYEPKVKASASDSQYDLSNVKAENVVMKPQRGKGNDKQDSREEKKSNEESDLEQLDHAKRDFKEIYDKIGDDTLEGAVLDEVEGILKLMKEKIRSRMLAIGFFQTFYDGTAARVGNRVPLAQFLFDNNYISQDDFIQGFAEATREVYMSDFPQSGKFFAKVFLDFAQTTSCKYKLSSALPLPDEMPEDEDDESLDFPKDLVNKVLSQLNSDYSNLKQELESDVQALADKLKA